MLLGQHCADGADTELKACAAPSLHWSKPAGIGEKPFRDKGGTGQGRIWVGCGRAGPGGGRVWDLAIRSHSKSVQEAARPLFGPHGLHSSAGGALVPGRLQTPQAPRGYDWNRKVCL